MFRCIKRTKCFPIQVLSSWKGFHNIKECFWCKYWLFNGALKDLVCRKICHWDMWPRQFYPSAMILKKSIFKQHNIDLQQAQMKRGYKAALGPVRWYERLFFPYKNYYCWTDPWWYVEEKIPETMKALKECPLCSLSCVSVRGLQSTSFDLRT